MADGGPLERLVRRTRYSPTYGAASALGTCPRPPGTALDYSRLVPECGAELRGAGKRKVSLPVVSHLPTLNSPMPTGLRTRLTPELSGSINREAIDLSA